MNIVKVFMKENGEDIIWQPYTQEQINSLLLLIDELCLEFDIPKVSVGHNVKLEKVENFNGITSKSNYNSEIPI